MKVQLIAFTGCPNADAAREALRRSLKLAGLEPVFEEIDSTAPEAPDQFRERGSPTVLIDGEDVAGQGAPTGHSCRLYRDATGRTFGWPPESLLLDAIRLAKRRG